MVDRINPPERTNPPEEETTPAALDPAKVETPAVPADPGEAVEEKGEPFDGNFA